MNSVQERSVDAEMVLWAYRLFFGREPESQSAIEHHVESHATLEALRKSFLNSDELKADLEGYRGIYELRDKVEKILDLASDPFTTSGLETEVASGKSRPGGVFFRGEYRNFWPKQENFASDSFLESYVLKGWMPAAPSINIRTKVTTFGSCFAVGIANHLSKLGYSIAKKRDPEIYISRMSEGFVNIYSILQQFEWALENKAPPENLWHGFNAEEYGYSENIRERTREVFLDTDFFIITLGLSEVWFDEQTGGVLWRGVPKKTYDAARHRFRLCSVDETKAKLSRIYEIIRRYVPAAKVLFTLSPIPLLATFRPVGCVTANAVSKSILRSALDEFYRDHPGDLNNRLFYFPSYEIAGELFLDKFIADCRHLPNPITDLIMQTFEAVHCETGRSMVEVNRLFHERRLANKLSIDLARL